LYRKARAGLIRDFTGVSSPYEEPISPDLELDTSTLALNECVNKVIHLLISRCVMQARGSNLGGELPGVAVTGRR